MPGQDFPLLTAGSFLVLADLATERWVLVHHGYSLEGAIELISTLAGTEIDIRHRINVQLVLRELRASMVALTARGSVADG
ncbi:MAG: hypothetical protein M3021_01990 [Actinomycetota bacterium]|nr:hypothetical protein [Actinomycetota bacterium]